MTIKLVARETCNSCGGKRFVPLRGGPDASAQEQCPSCDGKGYHEDLLTISDLFRAISEEVGNAERALVLVRRMRGASGNELIEILDRARSIR